MKTKPAEAGICIVDDDPAIRRALSRLVESVGLRAESFASPADFLSSGPAGEIDCLILDVQLPGMNGFELHDRILEAGMGAPVIFITAHPDENSRARARRADVVAFLEKPFDDRALFDALESALDQVIGGDPAPSQPDDGSH
jgi:FixJ family two-component response regulator